MDNNYLLDKYEQIYDMARHGIPEHVKRLKITSTVHHDYVSPLRINVEMMNGKRFFVVTSGHDKLGDIVNNIVRLANGSVN